MEEVGHTATQCPQMIQLSGCCKYTVELRFSWLKIPEGHILAHLPHLMQMSLLICIVAMFDNILFVKLI